MTRILSFHGSRRRRETSTVYRTSMSGRMQRLPEARTGTVGDDRSETTGLIARTAEANGTIGKRRPWARLHPMHSGFTTCTAMYGSGYRIATAMLGRSTRHRPALSTREVDTRALTVTVVCALAVLSAPPPICCAPTAVGATSIPIPAAHTAISVSARPDRLPTESTRVIPLHTCGAVRLPDCRVMDLSIFPASTQRRPKWNR